MCFLAGIVVGVAGVFGAGLVVPLYVAYQTRVAPTRNPTRQPPAPPSARKPTPPDRPN